MAFVHQILFTYKFTTKTKKKKCNQLPGSESSKRALYDSLKQSNKFSRMPYSQPANQKLIESRSNR
ncbi:hypothetical protein BLOT_012624 [Blomia tropicalis]|nr:hypothetical protein BLOT_012624 [Blomia tropicalis]